MVQLIFRCTIWASHLPSKPSAVDNYMFGRILHVWPNTSCLAEYFMFDWIYELQNSQTAIYSINSHRRCPVFYFMPGAIDLKARGVGGRKGSQFAAGGQTRLIILIKYYYIYNHSMGKQPVQGQKKSKDAIAKAASQTKAGVKKWTKGKAKEKADNAVFVDQATYDRLLAGIPKLGKHISTSTLIQKYKVVGSIARILLRRCVENGSIKAVESHSRQTLFTPIQVAEKAAPVAAETKEAPKKGKAPKKEK